MTDAIAQCPRLRPPLKWAGGKRWLVPILDAIWSKGIGSRLVEPFCGGLSVALGLGPQRALLNDINPHPINFYRQLQAGLRTSLRMQNDRDLYYQHRAKFNSETQRNGPFGKTVAALFYYLNRTGYNGLCRFNSKGEFNVPFGKHRSIRYLNDFTPYRTVLAGWEFTNHDFASLPVSGNDFVYADPPYDVEFRQYSDDGFPWPEQERLTAWLSGLDVPVVLSNQATPRIVALYRQMGFDLRFVAAPRRISRTGDRTPAVEVLALRNLPCTELSGTFATRRQALASIRRR